MLLAMGKIWAIAPVLVAPAMDSIDAPTGIGLSWTHIAGGSYYDIDIDTTPLFNSSKHSTIIGTEDYSSKAGGAILSDTVFELDYATKYYWKVTPKNLVGSSASNTLNFTTISEPKLFGPANMGNLDFNNDFPSVYHDLGTHFYYIEIGNTTVFTSPVYIQMFGDMILANHRAVLQLGPLSNITAGNTYYWRVKAYNNSDSSNWSDTLAFIAIDPLSTKEINVASSAFYPNPASNLLHFNNSESLLKLNIYDVQGSLFLTTSLQGSKSDLDVTHLSAGIYYLNLENIENDTSTHKLIITK